MATYCHNSFGLPEETLHDIADCLKLAMDASTKVEGYTQSEREARSYTRAALRDVRRLLGEVMA